MMLIHIFKVVFRMGEILAENASELTLLIGGFSSAIWRKSEYGS